jgi:predicted aspartyl protease
MEISRPSGFRQTDLEMTARSLLVSALAALSIASAAHAGCKLQNVASLDAASGPDGLLIVPVAVGDEHVDMLLDTGAERGVIDISVAQKMGLTPLKIYTPPPVFNVPGAPFLSVVQFSSPGFYLSDGSQLDHFVKIPAVALGASHFESVKFLLARFDQGTTSGIKGILGSNLLRNFDVEIDPAARKVNLFSPDHCEGKVVYWAPTYTDLPVNVDSHGQIEFTMLLDGHEVSAILDTGAPHTTLDYGYAQRTFDMDSGSPAVEHVSGAGKNAVYRARFKSLVAGDVTIKNPVIDLSVDLVARRKMAEALDSGYSASTTVHHAKLVLGMDVLKSLHLYIAYREEKLYLTAAAAH